MAANEKVRIKIKGYEHSVVDAAAKKIVEAATHNGARVAGPIPLPTSKEVVTILRAVHKYKDSREQFELRTRRYPSLSKGDRSSPDTGASRRRRDFNGYLIIESIGVMLGGKTLNH